MAAIRVSCPANKSTDYEITVGRGVLADIVKLAGIDRYTRCSVLLDSGLEKGWSDVVLAALKRTNVPADITVVEGGENCKNEAKLASLWKRFQELGLDRKSLVINIGGGALCDLGGFAAATYMRGLDFVNVPSTLLSQVDASVGGKLAINFGGIKNLVGVFNQPRAVIADTELLTTLPRRELNSGFAEVIKHGLIQNRSYLTLAERGVGEEIDQNWMAEIVEGSCKIKGKVVESDETEMGLRKILNFGHTLGHAVELLSYAFKSPLLHGEAVSIGMVGEAFLSMQAGKITQGDLSYIEGLLKKYSLPVRLSQKLPAAEIIAKTKGDKKNVGGKTKWTLLSKLGDAIYDVEIGEDQVAAAVGYISHV